MTLRVVDQTGDDELGDRFAKRVEAAVSQTRSAKVIAGKLVKAIDDFNTRGLGLEGESFEEFETPRAAASGAR